MTERDGGPNTGDYDLAIELITSLSPVDHYALSVEMAARVIQTARLGGLIAGLEHAVRTHHHA